MGHLEIEFKTLLSVDDFKRLMHQYFQNSQMISQENIYIDTHDFALRDRRMMLRIRQIQDTYMMTLKKQISHGVLEFDGTIEPPALDTHIEFIPHNILEQLHAHGIDSRALRIQGQLHTYRLEKTIAAGLLVLDKSEYCGIVDYELEFEAHDYDSGKVFFDAFLSSHNIAKLSDIPKSERFYRTLYKEKEA